MSNNGVLINAIPYPAVSRKQPRIRMTLTSEMTKEHLGRGYTELCSTITVSKVKDETTGFRSIGDLFNDHSVIPKVKGVYLVVRQDSRRPSVLSKGSGGF